MSPYVVCHLNPNNIQNNKTSQYCTRNTIDDPKQCYHLPISNNYYANNINKYKFYTAGET